LFSNKFQKSDTGITGQIIFNDDGKRTHFNLEVIELSKDGFKKIATWTADGGVDYTRSSSEVENEIMESLQNKTFIVTSRIGEPFLMERYL
jgi:glutamate receptor, ionotropic, invertebrate